MWRLTLVVRVCDVAMANVVQNAWQSGHDEVILTEVDSCFRCLVGDFVLVMDCSLVSAAVFCGTWSELKYLR